jgi:hypothetical protein
MLLTDEKLFRMKCAGYTHMVTYERWLPMAECWAHSGFPTTADAIEIYRAWADAVDSGEIRNLHIAEI